MHSTSGDTTIALTIAGSDSGGGAGIQADLKTFSALKVYGCSVVTAITAQNTRAVTAVHDAPIDVVAAQIRAVLEDIKVDAIKIGMLSSSAIIETVSDCLQDFSGPIVLDPVMVAKSGDCLLQAEAIDTLKTVLIPRATIITPNLPEAAVLLDNDAAHDDSGMRQQGEALLALGAGSVLMKGGHLLDDECTDWLIDGHTPATCFHSRRIHSQNTHGTGCTLSAAIAANLARGYPLPVACEQAHQYLLRAITCADQLTIGHGHGPVHHFHEVW